MVHITDPPRQAPPLIRLAEDLQALLRKWEAAREHQHGTGDLNAEWDALGDAWECREAIADTACLLLRLAVEMHPAFVRAILSDILVDFLADELPAAVLAVTGKGAR